MKKYGFIYITTNNINGKKYIGQRRCINEVSDERYLGSGTMLKRALNKYGVENFSREIIDYALTEDELNEKEIYYINKYDAINSNEFYNIHCGGRGGNTIAGWSEERLIAHKELMSSLNKGELNSMYGKKHSEESRSKISETRNKKVASGEYDDVYKTKEFRDKMSEVTSGVNNGMYGKKHSEESKRKMSENRKGLTSGSKNGNYGCKGEKAKNGKAVYKYADKEHKILVKRYNTVRLVLEEYEIKGHAGLMKAIKNNTEYKGYYWSKALDV